MKITGFLLSFALFASGLSFAQCTLNGVNGPCDLTGPLTVDTNYFAPQSTITTASGAIANNSDIQFSADNSSSTLSLAGDVTLDGVAGTLTLAQTGNGGVAFIQGNNFTLTNSTNTIQGAGLIGNGSLAVINQAGGVIDANFVGQSLTLNGSGGVTNAGLLRASADGTLVLGAMVDNSTGMISAEGGTVLFASTVTGGALNSCSCGVLTTQGSATLIDIALTSGSTYLNGNNATLLLSGIITNNGDIQIAADASGSGLRLIADTIVSGGGTVTLSQTGLGGPAYLDAVAAGLMLTNQDNLIQGQGTIGGNGLTLENRSAGVVDANVAGATLQIQGIVVNNTGTLQASAGTLALNGATVNSGMLTSFNGGVLATQGSASLNDVTLTGGSIYLNGNNATLYVSGKITNNGEIQVVADASGSVLRLTGDTTLTGAGTVTLSQTDQGGPAQILGHANGLTLTNEDNLIQGVGTIGGNNMTLVNQFNGFVDANVTGGTLSLVGPVTNQGILQASNGGTLELLANTVNNDGGGFISGFGGNVVLNGATVQGGALDGALETRGSATLDGTNGITLTAGSTYTNGNNATVYVTGDVFNEGDIDISAASGNSTLVLTGNTTLSGLGNITLSQTGEGGQASIQAQPGVQVLLNDGNWISGQGSIGNSGLNIINGSDGVIQAAGGGSLVIAGDSLSNFGVLNAADGGTLHVTAQLTNFDNGTLSGGEYDIGSPADRHDKVTTGTLKVDSLGTEGGEIVTNDAAIGLFGAGSMFVDSEGHDALSSLSDNTANGALGLFGGAVFSLQNDFTNEGFVLIDPASTFNVMGGHYTQGGESNSVTLLGGTISADVNVTGGTFAGDGTVNGNLDATGGVISPGLDGNTLTVNGNYTQGADAELDITIYDGSDYTVLDVLNAATLNGTLDLFFGSGYSPMAGQRLFIVNSGSRFGMFSNVIGEGLDAAFSFRTIYNTDGVEIDIDAAAPEPSTWLTIAGGLALLAGARVRQRRRTV